MMESSTRKEMIMRLDFFIGTWTVEIIHPHLRPVPIVGETRFEWLDDSYLIQHTKIEQPEFPSSTIIYDWNAPTGQYIQHYFDSRGVTRLYEMSFESGIWKLWREKPDFSPLDFVQRFIGTADESGNAIEASWEQSEDGVTWEHDFRLTFKKTN
ncbi:hypothetical protein [Planococcus dechangensis]|uniref:DUF1579 domain-containing protein n=1 Tax=Planococcus dechangensis TaxID=1176255 RepID=A0ABV9MEH8_9BACL